MIASGYGSCSTLIHLVAQHPKVSLAVGLATAILYLGSAVGPGYHSGNDATLREFAAVVESKSGDAEIIKAFNAIWSDEADVSDEILEDTIRKCSCKISVEDVRGDRSLLRNTVFLYFLDNVHANGLAEARKALSEELASHAGNARPRHAASGK
jgi:hypothetical protein